MKKRGGPPTWKEEHNRSHKRVRARLAHTFARMKGWKILRGCRLKGDGVPVAMLAIARLHNLALDGQMTNSRSRPPQLEDHLRASEKAQGSCLSSPRCVALP